MKRLIDLAAYHKLSVFHLDLTDDQGWRIEITSRPLPTEIGGSSQVGGGPGGFYSQADYAGIEAALFTEWVTSAAEIDLLTFPRLAGYAEIGWSPATGRSWDEYRVRLAHHGARFDALGVEFYRSPVVDWMAESE